MNGNIKNKTLNREQENSTLKISKSITYPNLKVKCMNKAG